MKPQSVLKIGIMSREEFKNFSLAVARGEKNLPADGPKLWFSSLESFLQLVSDKNQSLLKMIRDQHPESLSQLALMSHRTPGNLSRTLHNMERHGLVTLEKVNGRTVPRVTADKLQLEIAL